MVYTVLVAIFGATAYAFLATPSYTALSKVLVKMGREQTSALDLAKRPADSVIINARLQDIFDEVEILRDPVIMTAIFPELKVRAERSAPIPEPHTVLQWIKYALKSAKRWFSDALVHTWEWIKYPLYELGLSRRLSPDEKLKQAFRKALKVNDIKETDVIVVGFSWPDPGFAAFVVNSYLDEYRRQHLRVHGSTSGSVAFYEEQASRVAVELSGIDKELDNFLAQAGISDLAAEKQATLQFIVQLESQQNQSAIEQQETRERIRVYRELYRSTSEWLTTPELKGTEVAGLAALDQQFVNLVTRRNALRERYEAGYWQVRDVDKQIAALRTQKLLSLNAYLEDRTRTLRQGDSQRRAKIEERRAYLEKLRDLSLEYEALINTRNTIQSELANYRRKLEELRTAEGLNAQDFASVSVISKAKPEDASVSPRKGLIIGLAALFGVIFAAAYALLAEFFDQTFRNERDVEVSLGIPLLAKVPEVKPGQ